MIALVTASFGVLAALVIVDLCVPKAARRVRRALLISIIVTTGSVIVFGVLAVVDLLMA